MKSCVRLQSLCVTLLGLVFTTATADAQTSYPMLMSLEPVAAQAGQTSEHTVKSRYSMYGAYQVLVTGEGVTGEVVLPEEKGADAKGTDAKEDGKQPDEKAAAEKKEIPNLQELKVKFTVAPDALPGIRDFRLLTPQGASTLGQLVIVRDPVVAESAKNNAPEEAQQISLPATVCGAIERAEDVDFYRFQVEPNTAWNFHVRCMRLQDKIHDLQQHADPIITLRNAAGVTLASSDNHFAGDPLLSHEFDEGGEYLLEIRDVRYQGNAYWQYSVEIASRPFVSSVFPMAVAQGGKAEVQLVGYQLPETPAATLDVPADLPPGTAWLPLPLPDGASDPVPVVVNPLENVVEPPEENNTVEQATPIPVPAGVSGRIESEADIDYYAFDAKKGESFTVEVLGKRNQSSLDSHLRIVDASGKQLALNDDMRIGKRSYSDSQVENWTAPADGRYCLEVRDLHLRGGVEFGYFIRVTRSEPGFELFADTDKTQLTPGTSGVVFVRVERKNGFQGEVQLHVDGLPEGVSADCGRILAGKGQDGAIVLHAAEDAKLTAANITIRGTATHPVEGSEPLQLSAIALPYQETYQPGGGRGHWPVEMHTVAVGAASDILSVKLSEYDITLAPGESKKIDVTIQRAEGFDKNVTLDVIYKHLNSTYGSSLPEGVTLDAKNSNTLLTGTTSEGHITLTAAKDAQPVENQLVPVMANVSLNFVMKATYASQPLQVSVSGN